MNEGYLRIGFFVLALVVFALWEIYHPRVKSKFNKKIRWSTNLGLVFFNTLIIRIIIPVTSVVVCLYAHNNQIGLFNNVSLSPFLVIVLSVLLLDLIVYFQHITFHHLPILWRLHQIHHIDQEIDVTTALRFHPIEILISLAIKYAMVLIFGISVITMIIFETLLNVSAMFNHSNIYIPKKIDRILRGFIVTPDMHRIHHSTIVRESNQNFGFSLSIWDRLFQTYKQRPEQGIEQMSIGLKEYPMLEKTRFFNLLVLPFKKSTKKC